MSELYRRIRARREELGMSQEELANKLGYKSRSSINKIEKGENDIPQSKIVSFAKALQTTPEFLMGWDDKEQEVAASESYYYDDEVAAIANEMKDNPGIRVLFDASRGLKKESIEEVRRFIEFQKAKERGDYEG